MKNKSGSQSVLICLFVILAFAVCDSPPRADATTTTWRGTTGDWFYGANWNPRVPDSSTDALINNGGKATINSSGATARSLTLGLNAGDSGTVSVDGGYGTLFVPLADCINENPAAGAIYVGYRGGGKLTITNGGAVTSGLGYIAALTSELFVSNGAVTVDGAGSVWYLSAQYCFPRLFVGGTEAGDGGTGLLSVTNGGAVWLNTNGSTSPSVTVGLSGTLTGNGSITTSSYYDSGRAVVVRGTLAPSWTLSIGASDISNLILQSSATTQCNVTPQNLGSVDVSVSGTATLNGRLSVIMTGTFTASTQFTLLHAAGGLDPTHNRFASVSITYPPVPTYTPVITYDANNVYLYLRPN